MNEHTIGSRGVGLAEQHVQKEARRPPILIASALCSFAGQVRSVALPQQSARLALSAARTARLFGDVQFFTVRRRTNATSGKQGGKLSAFPQPPRTARRPQKRCCPLGVRIAEPSGSDPAPTEAAKPTTFFPITLRSSSVLRRSDARVECARGSEAAGLRSFPARFNEHVQSARRIRGSGIGQGAPEARKQARKESVVCRLPCADLVHA